LSITGSENFKRAFRPLLPGVTHIRYNNPNDLAFITTRTAAVVLEAVQGEAGVQVPAPAYLQALQDRCRQTGALLILDEIQTGFGRTGTFWAFEQYNFLPDILLCAKGMGGGMPIGAFIASSKIMAVFKNDPILGHITTFGGHPVSCAAALATLQIIQSENFLASIPPKSALFRKLLVHPHIITIRSCGLLMAVEFKSFALLKKIIDRAINKGVLTDWFLFCDSSMRIAPPLIITAEEITEACRIIIESINEVSS
jgi:acetylornithine/succinyldiaminopimelate/putrescine aminotransferase